MASTSTSQTLVQMGQPGQQADDSGHQGQNSGDWTHSLLQLATTAQLKKHAFNLQLQTAQVLAAHQCLQERSSTIEDIKAQKNWLESERLNLLNQLRFVNEDREKADALEADIQKECDHYRTKIQTITDGEYAEAKTQVDVLRAQLGMSPTRSLQSILDETSAAYLQQRRLAHAMRPASENVPAVPSARLLLPSDALLHASTSQSASALGSSVPKKRPAKHGREEDSIRGGEPRKKRGRPKGSKNKATIAAASAATSSKSAVPALPSAAAASASVSAAIDTDSNAQEKGPHAPVAPETTS